MRSLCFTLVYGTCAVCVKQKLSPPPAPKRTVVLEKHVSIEIATTWGVDTRKYPMEPVVVEISIFET